MLYEVFGAALGNSVKWGLVVQGPSISAGGPRFRDGAYDCSQSVAATLEKSSTYFDEVVVSCWQGDVFDENSWPQSVVKVESPLPDFDKANYRKQFVSTLAGLRVLKAADVGFVVKVRSDQVLTGNAFADIRLQFENPANQKKLMLSDFVAMDPFYAGDFVFAGSLNVVESWTNAVLGFGAKDLHLSIGTDYVLKYLCATDPRFPKYLNPLFPAIFQISDPRNVGLLGYWEDVRSSRFDFLRRQDFSEILWRGEPMSEIVNVDGFCFREQNVHGSETLARGEVKSTLFAALRVIYEKVRLEIRMLELVHKRPFWRQFWRGVLRGEWRD